MTDSSIDRLLSIMQTLRDPEKGCNWDVQQTFRSLLPHTIEEAYEVADCIERDDFDSLPAELGDLLFQVVFYAEIGKEQGKFDFNEIVTLIADKLERRHPHVFAQHENITADEQTERWEAIKAQERADHFGHGSSALDDVPLNLPALVRAEKLQKRAARVGFDWPSVQGVKDKLHEELEELEQACQQGDKADIAEEFGDVLFSCVNLGRFLGLHSESVLRSATQKFDGRFRFIERVLEAQGRLIEEQSLEALELLWQEAKTHDKESGSEAFETGKI